MTDTHPSSLLPTSPAALRRRSDRLLTKLEEVAARQRQIQTQREAIAEYLSAAEGVRDALEQLGQKLFGEVIAAVEVQLSRALQEVLEQSIELKAIRAFKSGTATIEFHIQRQGQKEDIIEGQGGSVANVLSVGLRLLALTTLDAAIHRRFLVLDEQDCWLHPALVPRLVKIVQEAGRTLGFQTLLISHHDPERFERYADRIYRVTPSNEGLLVRRDAEDPGA